MRSLFGVILLLAGLCSVTFFLQQSAVPAESSVEKVFCLPSGDMAPAPLEVPKIKQDEKVESLRPKAESKPEEKRYTEVECRQHGSYCIYTNLCYDGDSVLPPSPKLSHSQNPRLVLT
jgi:hypothetical protein